MSNERTPFTDYDGQLVTSPLFTGVGIVESGYIGNDAIWLMVRPRLGDYDGLTKRGMSGRWVRAEDCVKYFDPSLVG